MCVHVYGVGYYNNTRPDVIRHMVNCTIVVVSAVIRVRWWVPRTFEKLKRTERAVYTHRVGFNGNGDYRQFVNKFVERRIRIVLVF